MGTQTLEVCHMQLGVGMLVQEGRHLQLWVQAGACACRQAQVGACNCVHVPTHA